MQGSVGVVGPVGQAVKWFLLCQKVLKKKKRKKNWINVLSKYFAVVKPFHLFTRVEGLKL